MKKHVQLIFKNLDSPFDPTPKTPVLLWSPLHPEYEYKETGLVNTFGRKPILGRQVFLLKGF